MFVKPFATMQEARHLFDVQRQKSYLNWDNLISGCFARCHVMAASIINEDKIYCRKAFIMSGARLEIGSSELNTPKISPRGLNREWPIHTAPILAVRDDLEMVRANFIIDPSVFDEPQPLINWKTALGDADALISLTHWRNFICYTYEIDRHGNLRLSDWKKDDDLSHSGVEIQNLRY